MGAPLAVALTEADFAAHLARCGVETRAATGADLDFAFEALRAAMHAYVAEAFGAWDDAHQRSLFAPSFDRRTHRVLRVDGADAGILAVAMHVDRVHLERIYLLPPFQRRGVGGRTVGSLLAWSHARGLPVVLTVLRTNPDALRLYERLGFRVVGDTRTHLHLECEPEGESARFG